MSKETIGYVELEWHCPYCGGRNPGSAKICGQCDAPQPADVEFVQPAQETLITDEATIADIKKGADIHCAYCGTRNPADATTCRNCLADLSEGQARRSGQVIGRHRHEAAADVTCAHCGATNPGTARKCSQCGATLAAPAPAPAAAATTKKPTRPGRGVSGTAILIVLGLVAVACIAFFIFASRTSDVVGRVVDVRWERSVVVEAFGPVQHEGWYDEIPAGAPLGQCSERLNRTQSDPHPNAEKVCGTPFTVDEGSGFGEVVQECVYNVYEDWCTYEVDDWQAVDTAVLEGDNLAPIWPALSLDENEREGARQEQLEVIFSVDGDRHVYRVDNPGDFAAFAPGSEWQLTVNALGGVVDVAPAP